MKRMTFGRRRPLLAAAAIALALAGLLVPGQATAQAERGWVTGTVVGTDGKPVAGALVNVLEPREVPERGIIAEETDRRTWTDTDGSFRVREGRTGYLVQVCEPYLGDRNVCREPASGVRHLITYVGPAGVTDSWVLQTSLFAVTGTQRDLGVIEAKPQGRVHGRMSGAANAELRIMRLNDTMAYRTFTDAEGYYRFIGLAPGRYYVEGGGDGRLPWRSDVITVKAPGDIEVNGSFTRGATIRGQLTAGGKAVPGTDVLVRRVGHGMVAATTTDSRGRYHVSGMLPGKYKVGILYSGSDYIRHGVDVTVPEADSVVSAPVAVRVGATLTLHLRNNDGTVAGKARDELRNVEGRPIQGRRNLGDGVVTYTGLRKGTYTIVAGTKTHYGLKTVKVERLRIHDLGSLRLRQPGITLTGRTAPNAVVEAMSGNQCPPDGPVRVGSWHHIVKADASGRYTITGLVPGFYMLGADGWPENYAPRCRSDVKIWSNQSRDIPLEKGSTASGRLVYAETGTPVITTLSYELFYPKGLATNPTNEHPARARTRAASGEFSMNGLSAGTVRGELAESADYSQLTSAKYLVIFPFQDGTPYYLSSESRSIDVGAGEHLGLGDIPLTINR